MRATEAILAAPTAMATLTVPNPERRDDRERQEQAGDGQQHVGPAHDEVVDASAAEAGDEAEPGTDQDPDGHSDGGGRESEGCAVHDAGVQVAADLICAEPVLERRRLQLVGGHAQERVAGGQQRRHQGGDRHEHEPHDGGDDRGAPERSEQPGHARAPGVLRHGVIEPVVRRLRERVARVLRRARKRIGKKGDRLAHRGPPAGSRGRGSAESAESAPCVSAPTTTGAPGSASVAFTGEAARRRRLPPPVSTIRGSTSG